MIRIRNIYESAEPIATLEGSEKQIKWAEDIRRDWEWDVDLAIASGFQSLLINYCNGKEWKDSPAALRRRLNALAFVRDTRIA